MSSVHLVLRAQSGDREALEAVLRDIQEPLFRYIVRLTADTTMAEDVLQNALLTICKKIGWVDQPELFSAWCYRIAARETFKTLRREKKWRHAVRDEDVLESVATLPSPDAAIDVPRMIDRAPPATRPVLVLFYLDGLRLEEVAEVLGIATGTVKSRLAYGLQSLRRLMKEKS